MDKLNKLRRRLQQRGTGADQQQSTSLDANLPNPRSHPSTDGIPSVLAPVLLSFPDGVKILYNCPNATVDICFIHGLTGDRESTWTANGQASPWPETLLPPRLNKARILTYGYDAYVMRKGAAGLNRLVDHATNLLHDLTAERASNASSRPLIFVTHSLGGLICKEAILISRDNPEVHLQSIFDCVKSVIFMGTPHRGSWMAYWANLSTSVLGLVKSTNSSLLEVLEKDDQLLESIQLRFWAMVRGRERNNPLSVTCFFEELPLPKIGKVVVTKDSATLEGYPSISIHANHREMVRFASAEDTGFKRVFAELVRWESEIIPSPPITAPQPSQDCLGCLRSLAFPQMETRSHDVTRATTGTCNWLFKHDKYTSWAARDRGLLWIKGKPGSGKSTLLKHAVGHRKASHRNLVLSFFFHGRGEELQRTPLGLFRSLLHQILRLAPDPVPDLIETFNRRYSEVGEPGEKWQWHQEELRRFVELSLLKVLETNSRSVWLWVDALDECGQENAVDLFQWLKSLLDLSPTSSQLRICVTCRHYPILDWDSEFEIHTEHENAQDISTYVRGKLRHPRELAESPIPALVTNRASGIFMWACLVVKRVLDLERGGETLKRVEVKVGDLPTDLDKLYQDLIRNMGRDSLKLIQWICFAIRPLTLDELRWAMVVESDFLPQSLQDCKSSDGFVSDNDRMKKQVQTLTCGLAEVILSSYSQVVQFIHQSVKDFFIEKGLQALDSNSTSTDMAIGMVHYRLARACIRYLAMKEIGQSTELSHWYTLFPFLSYATTSWVAHAQQCDARGIPQDYLLTLFSWPSNDLVDLWVRVYDIVGDRHSGDSPRKGSSLLHVMSRYGIFGPLRVILRRAYRVPGGIDAKDVQDRTPLSWASVNGHEDIVKLLLDTQKVSINSRDQFGQTPLSWAASNGHFGVVKLLLDVDEVDVDSKDDDGRTPLSWASGNKHDAIVKLLCGTGKADINSTDEDTRTPLLHAAADGNEAVVKLLLATGKVDVDLKDNYYSQTSLSWAAEKGHTGVVELLLATGEVDINSEDKNGRSLLSWAAGNGHTAIVKLLLATDEADIDSKDQYDRTPLSWAAWSKHEAIFMLLHATGMADVNLKDVHGRTYLSRAAENGRMDVMKLLLSTGEVNIDTKDEYGRTPLSWASEGGHEDVANLLLDTGRADIHAKDNNGRTPLSWASQKGYKGSVQILLGDGSNIDLEDDKGWTPLRYSAWGGHDTVVRLLVDKGANIELADQHGRTLLSWAAEEGNDAAVRLLLSNGVNTQSEDQNGWTPLWYAISKGHEAVVRRLLSTSVNIKWADREGRTLMSLAIRGGQEITVRLLLDRGASIESADQKGRTLLSWAAQDGREVAMKLLLANGAKVDSVDQQGRTPLSWAAWEGHEATIRLLLDDPAVKKSVDQQDQQGRSPLSWAAWRGRVVAVQLLLDNHVKVESQDLQGRTPLWYAVFGGHEAVVRLLVGNGADVEWADKDGHTLMWYADNGGNDDIIEALFPYE